MPRVETAGVSPTSAQAEDKIVKILGFDNASNRKV